MKLINESVQRPVGVIILVIVMMILGVVSLTGLGLDLLPDLNLPITVVMTSYSGAAPQEVENLVTRPLEGVLSSVEGLDTMRSISASNQSVIFMMYDFGTNLDTAMMELRDRIDLIRAALPEGAADPSILRFDPNDMPILQLGVSGDLDLHRLTQLTEERVMPQLERIPGVGQVSITGGEEREIVITPDTTLLQNHNLTVAQLAQIIGSENRSAPAGQIQRGTQQLPLRMVGDFVSVEDIAQIPIPLPSGDILKLSDLATIEDTFKERSSYAYVNGEPTISIDITKQGDANTVEVSSLIKKELESIQTELPQGVTINTIMDSAMFINESIKSVVINMILGGVMSILILLLFLRSIRSTLVIGFSIPIALISAFTLLYFAGQSLNILTLGGLALGIGLMVDSSIVILENIYKYRERGETPIEAAKKGAKEIAGAVIATTITSIVVFVPIIFTDGIASEIFMPLAITVSFTLLASLLVSLTLVPMLSRLLLPAQVINESPTGLAKLGSALGKGLERINRLYRNLLQWVLQRKKRVVFGTLLLLVLSVAMIPFVGVEFIPSFDQGEIMVSVDMLPGTQVEETKAALDSLAEFLEGLQVSEVILTSVGGGGVGMGGGMGQGSSETGELYSRFVPADERQRTTQEVIEELHQFAQTLPDIEVNIMDIQSGGMSGDPIEIQIIGDDLEQLKWIADDIQVMVEDIPGTTNVTHSMGETRPELQIHVDRDLAAQYGLRYAEIMQTVSSSVSGQVATLLRSSGQEIEVIVILPEEERNDLQSLRNLTLMSPLGDVVPLSAVAEVVSAEGPNVINRQDQTRGVTVTGSLSGRDLGSVIEEIQQKLDQYIFPDGYEYKIGGEFETMMEAYTDLTLALLLAIFLVYAVMAFQFEKVVYPFIVMFSLPTTFIGIMIGFVVTGRALSAPAFIGVIMLAGIVVNNAIILVDYINTLRKKGLSREEAILEAGQARLRPILMTMLTTVLAMVPLAIGIGEGAELQAPLATVIVFGLSFSTLITLVLVPVMYIYMDNLTEWFKSLFKRKDRNEESLS